MPIFLKSDPIYAEPRFPVLLLVDTSDEAMIDEVNQRLVDIGKATEEKRFFFSTDIAVVSFDSSVRMDVEFCPASDYEAPTLKASSSGLSVMSEGIEFALDMLETYTDKYKENGIAYKCPLLLLIARGVSTDTEREDTVRSRLQNKISNYKVNYIPIALGDKADVENLKSYSPDNRRSDRVLSTDTVNFMDAFRWMGGDDLLEDEIESECKPSSEVWLSHSIDLPQEIAFPVCTKFPRKMHLSYNMELPLKMQLPLKGDPVHKAELPVEVQLSLTELDEGRISVELNLIPSGSALSYESLEMPPIPDNIWVSI